MIDFATDWLIVSSLQDDESTTQSTIVFPTYLIVLICILIAIAIIGCVYKIFAYRRVSIAAKKIDYLVEDLIYKSEYIMPSIEAVSEFASYTNLADLVFNRNKNKTRTIKTQKESKTEIEKAKKISHEEISNELKVKKQPSKSSSKTTDSSSRKSKNKK